MWGRIATFILRRRIPILILLAIATTFMGYHAQNVKMSYKFAGLLPEDDSTQIAYERFLEQFSEDGNVMVLGVQGEELYNYRNFRDWHKLGNDLMEIEGVDSIFSEAHLFKLVKNTEERRFNLEPVVKKVPTSRDEVDSLVAEINSLPFYKGLLSNDSTDASLMMVFVNAEKFNSEDRGHVVENIRNRAEEFSEAHNMQVHYSGLPYIRTVTSERVKDELGMFVGLAGLVAATLLFLFFRSFKVVIICLLVVAAGVVWSLGTMALFDFRLTMLMALIPPLMIVIGIPNCVFLLNKYHQEYRGHGKQMKALARVIQRIGNATFMTNCTTATGFVTFVFTSSAVLQEFGVIASINIINVFFLSVLIVPTVFSFFAEPRERHTKHLDRKWTKGFVDWLVLLVSRHRKAIYIITAMALVAGGFGINMIETSGRIVDDLPQDDSVVRDLTFFEENFGGVMPLEVLISAKEGGGRITSEGNLRRIENLQKKIEEYPEISRSLSIVDAVKFAKQGYYNNNPRKYALISGYERSFIQPYLRDGGAGGKDLAQMFVDSTQSTARITAQIADIGTEQMDSLMAKIEPQVAEVFPPDKYEVTFTGSSIVFVKGTNYLVKNLFISLAIAIVLIAIIMSILFTSARMVLISLFPNLIPLICTGALMGYFGVPLKPSTILVFSIAFGISVDDTIHFLAKYRQEIKLREWDLRTATLMAVRETGLSMFYTSVILFFGFAMFVASTFGGIVALGLLVSVTLLIAMFTNLVLLPSMLLSFQKAMVSQAFEREPLVEIVDEEEDIDLENLEVRGQAGESIESKSKS